MSCAALRPLLDRVAAGDEDLSASERERLDAHVVACGDCAEDLAALREVAAGLGRVLTPPEGALSDAELAQRITSAVPSGRVLRIGMRAAVAASLVAALAGVAWQFRPLPTDVVDLAWNDYVLAPPEVADYAGPRFDDVTRASGLQATFGDADAAPRDWMVQVVGHGAAVFDMDADGDLDLFVPHGNRMESLGDDGVDLANSWRLYRNDGGLHFTDVTEGSGLITAAWAGGAVAGDVDSDGLPDLFVPCFGENLLFRNLGGGRFEEIAGNAGVRGADREWSTAASLGDIDGDGDLDLYVANYADMRAWIVESGVGRNCKWRQLSVPCGPQPLEPQSDRLYLNDGDGTFTDVSADRTPRIRAYSFQPVMLDIDDDGHLDIFVACDGHPNQLLLNDGRGSFTDHALAAGVAADRDGRDQACMGVGAGDIDGDGRPDLYITNFSHEPNVLYHQRESGPGRPTFDDSSDPSGLSAPSLQTLGWGAALIDLDCDGDLDAVSANGHLYPGVEEGVSDTTYAQHVALFENDGRGVFREVTASAGSGLRGLRPHRGLVVADLDGDLQLDLVLTVLNGGVVVLRNDGRGCGASVLFDVRRRDGVTEGSGARLRATVGTRTILRDVMTGSSFASSEDPRTAVGIGDAAQIDQVVVRWPARPGHAAVEETFGPFEPGRVHRLVEGQGR